MKTFREYLEGREVNESFFRNAALAGATALGLGLGLAGGQAKAEDWKSFRSPESFKPNDTPQHHRELLDSIFDRDEAREAAKTPYEKLMDKVRKARKERGETPKIDINKLNKYVGDTPDKFEKLKRFYQKVPDDGQRDPRSPRPDPEVEKIMKEVEAQEAKKKEEERAEFLQSIEKAKRFAR
jgi:hypothetical protein